MKIIISESQYKKLNSYNNHGVNLIINEAAGRTLEPLSEGWLNTLADIVGIFDPTGLVDIGNAISYWSQGKNTFALLTLVSAIPGVDWATKPFVLGGKIVAGISKIKILGWLVRTMNKWVGKALDMIDKMLLSKIPIVKNFADAMRSLINGLKKDSQIKLNESKFSKKCEGGIFSSGYKKGTKEFDDCINKEEKLAALDEQKKQIINDEKNKKAQQKQELDQDKIREEQSKILKMKPEDRLAYTCSEKFGFRKGSDKFKDCVFKLYAAEVELEKLELQRQLAKANAETARANAEAVRAGAERQERLALAQTEAAKMQALAARQQAIAANTADSMALIESGLRMMSPQRQAPRMQTNCFYHARSLSCF